MYVFTDRVVKNLCISLDVLVMQIDCEMVLKSLRIKKNRSEKVRPGTHLRVDSSSPAKEGKGYLVEGRNNQYYRL